MAKAQSVKIKSTEFQAKNEYLLVKPDELEQYKTTESGIVLAYEQSSIERPTSGIVQSVGSDIEDIAVGDMVLWPMTDGLDIEFTDGIMMLLRYKSIIGKKA